MERRYEQGILAGIGTGLSLFSFELRYEAGNGMSDYALVSRTKRGYLLLGYRF